MSNSGALRENRGFHYNEALLASELQNSPR
jgi:hypothetical protein